MSAENQKNKITHFWETSADRQTDRWTDINCGRLFIKLFLQDKHYIIHNHNCGFKNLLTNFIRFFKVFKYLKNIEFAII